MPDKNPPVFPQDFISKGCRQVREAALWRSRCGLPPDKEDSEAHADCAFVPAGYGMKCEMCNMFMTRPFCGHKLDEEFLPKIERYHHELAAWRDNQQQEEAMRLDAMTSACL